MAKQKPKPKPKPKPRPILTGKPLSRDEK